MTPGPALTVAACAQARTAAPGTSPRTSPIGISSSRSPANPTTAVIRSDPSARRTAQRSPMAALQPTASSARPTVRTSFPSARGATLRLARCKYGASAANHRCWCFARRLSSELVGTGVKSYPCNDIHAEHGKRLGACRAEKALEPKSGSWPLSTSNFSVSPGMAVVPDGTDQIDLFGFTDRKINSTC